MACSLVRANDETARETERDIAVAIRSLPGTYLISNQPSLPYLLPSGLFSSSLFIVIGHHRSVQFGAILLFSEPEGIRRGICRQCSRS